MATDEPTPNEDRTTTEDGSVVVPTSLHGPAWEWTRRILIALVLGVAVVMLVLVSRNSETGLEQGTKNPVVVSRFPLPDAQAPSQSQVGISLQPGYDGTMFINGTQIPEEQLDGAVDPKSLSKDELKRFGVRPNGRNRIFYTPDPGKVFKELPKGQVVVTVQYHKDRAPNVDAGTVSWTFVVQ